MKGYKIENEVFVTRRILLSRLEDVLLLKAMTDEIGDVDFIYDVHHSTEEGGLGYRYVAVIMYNKAYDRSAKWIVETLTKTVNNFIITDE